MKFIIKAGRHYADKLLGQRLLFRRGINFSFRVGSSCMYDPAGVVNGWSKIFGIAEPWGHRNSCRLVFGCFAKDTLTIGMYCYVGGVSPQENADLKKPLCDIRPDTWYNGQIAHYIRKIDGKMKHYYYIAVWGNGIAQSHMIPCRRYMGLRFLLHPYIGGRFTLDQDAVIDIESPLSL